jgi:hypothetical protein
MPVLMAQRFCGHALPSSSQAKKLLFLRVLPCFLQENAF